MPHLTPKQIKRLGSFTLSRDGIVIPGAHAIGPGACWNFALTGTVLAMSHADSPQSICDDIFDMTLDPNVENVFVTDEEEADVEFYRYHGIRPTATVMTFPNCANELGTLRANFVAASGGNPVAQTTCREALAIIFAKRNGLQPGVVSDQYQLHMRTHAWFAWDHFAISLRPAQPGRPRIYIQKVTGITKPLKHACWDIWDEHLDEVTLNIGELHATQIAFINMVNTYGDLCVECGEAHGYFRSNPFHAWHRCTTCGAIYCPRHGAELLGKRAWNDRTRSCGQTACVGRTTLISSV
jgi:hypothetical protein